ncbi:helix-turn-helix domain-containing protein [Paenibacillus xylanilyticus]|uniref:helix-turn-helix domain-containing protein n=1 Tax=Paenibacillus xylanilyticus TaxID=248903 RepID=UPI003AADD3E8
MTITITLRELLTQKGLTQKQLSQMTGIRAAAISNLCRGYVDRVCIEHLEKIASALDIRDIRDLIRLEAVA